MAELVHNLAPPLPSLVFLLPVFAFVDTPLRTLGTTDLTWDVIALRSHDSELVRALTTSIVREWRATATAHAFTSAAANGDCHFSLAAAAA